MEKNTTVNHEDFELEDRRHTSGQATREADYQAEKECQDALATEGVQPAEPGDTGEAE